MKKILLFLLFLTSLHSSIYPLTEQDWNVIFSLKVGGIVGGGLLGYIPGKIASSAIAKHIAPSLTHTDVRATQAIGHIPTQQKIGERIFKRSISYLPFAPAIYGGSLLGRATGQRLAVFYIARKYGVDTKTAQQAIEEDLDLQKD